MMEKLYRMCPDCNGSGFQPPPLSETFMCFRYSCSTCKGQGFVEAADAERDHAIGQAVRKYLESWTRPTNWMLSDLVRKIALELHKCGFHASATLEETIARILKEYEA